MNEQQIKASLAAHPKQPDAADVMQKIKTAETMETIKHFAQSPNAERAKGGDLDAMRTLIADMMSSAEGQSLIEQVKNAANN